jgi:hypothetical protein
MGKQTGEPLGTRAKEVELIVEEHIELLDLNTKKLREAEMSSLM